MTRPHKELAADKVVWLLAFTQDVDMRPSELLPMNTKFPSFVTLVARKRLLLNTVSLQAVVTEALLVPSSFSCLLAAVEQGQPLEPSVLPALLLPTLSSVLVAVVTLLGLSSARPM